MKLVNELRDKVARLEKELANANNHIQFLSKVTGNEMPPAQQTKALEPDNQKSSMFDQQAQI